MCISLLQQTHKQQNTSTKEITTKEMHTHKSNVTFSWAMYNCGMHPEHLLNSS